MIKEFQIRTSKSARYYSLGGENQKIKKLWFVFHGYGELAEEFIQNFQFISNENSLIIAIEGLNKFYLRGFSGKVGASWMTKEAREEEILDYINMIDTIYNNVISSIESNEYEITVLGFSQGSHTAVRWLSERKIKIEKLILWSGTFPHDCNYTECECYWNSIEKKIIIGDQDRLINKEKLQTEIDSLKEQKLSFEIIKFKGGHEINADILKKLSV